MILRKDVMVLLFFLMALLYFKLQEWRAQQIASGEAKENANFQPLGGDWYCFIIS